MKVLITICLVLISIDLQAQSLSIFDIDTTNFPTMKAKFYAFDKDGNQITNLSTTDFEIKEDGLDRKVINVSCPIPEPPKPISAVLTLDVSGSMQGERLKLIKDAASLFVNGLDFNLSECSVTSFNNANYLNQDFTQDKSKLLNAINNFLAFGGTNYDNGLLNPMAGSLQISKTGKNKKVVIFLTDGLPNNEPKVNEIIAEAKSQNCVIYSIVVGLKCPQNLKEISSQTGGKWFESIENQNSVLQIYKDLLIEIRKSSPCNIEWQSQQFCSYKKVNVLISLNNLLIQDSARYQNPHASIAKLEFSKNSLIFKDPILGKLTSQNVMVKAKNTDIEVTNISSNNPRFSIDPIKFSLKENDSIELNISYNPENFEYSYAKFNIETNLCTNYYYTSGGYRDIPPEQSTFRITKPQKNDIYVTGSDTIITWIGIPDNDTVSLKYSLDNGQNWSDLTNKSTNLKENWMKIPNNTSNECLIKASQLENIDSSDIGKLKYTLGSHSSNIYKFLWSPDGTKISTLCENVVEIWNSFGSEKLRSFNFHEKTVYAVCWSPDSKNLLSLGLDGKAIIWNISTGKRILTLDGINVNINQFFWSPNGNYVVIPGADTLIKIWDVSNGKEIISINTKNKYYVNLFSISPDGNKIVTNFGNKVNIWDIHTGYKLLEFDDHKDDLLAISWSPDGRKIASSSGDFSLIIWDSETGQKITTLIDKFNYGFYNISWNSHSDKIITQSSGYEVWDINLSEKIKIFQSTSDLKWSPDSKKIALMNNQNELQIYNTDNWELKYSFKAKNNYTKWVEWSPDGKFVANNALNFIEIWDANVGEKFSEIGFHSDIVNKVSWCSKDDRIASASRDNSIIIWDGLTGNEITTLKKHKGSVVDVSWSPNGSIFYSHGLDNTIYIWDGTTYKVLNIIEFSSNITSICWNNEGTKLAISSSEINAIIWDPLSGSKLLTLSGHSDIINKIIWDPSNKFLVTASNDRTIKIWDAISGKLLHSLRQKTYNFSTKKISKQKF